MMLATTLMTMTHAVATPDAEVSEFPVELQLALHDLHQPKPGKRGGSGRPFIPAEDALILQKHVRDGVRLSQIRLPGREDKPNAARCRHNEVLKKLPGYSTYVDSVQAVRATVMPTATAATSTVQAASAATKEPVEEQQRLRLQACDFALPDGVHEDLVRLHSNTTRAQTKSPWAIEEDARLLEAFFAEESISHAQVGNRSSGANRRRLCALKQELRCTRCAFHSAQCNPEAPALQLEYDTWTRIADDRAIPREAEIDWLRGVARAPASWELRLGSSCFCLYDSDAHKPACTEAADTFVLEDVRPDMTIWALQQHITRWMQTSASPTMAHGVDHSTVRLAILSENATPTGSMRAESTRTYNIGEPVYYRCRDGVPRPATIVASDLRSSPQRYVIAVDRGNATVEAGTLSATRPLPPAAPDATGIAAPEATLSLPPTVVPMQPFEIGEDVWYSGSEVSVPCRARIYGIDMHGLYNVTLEAEERDTTVYQLMPRVSESSPGPSPAPWQAAEIDKILQPHATVRSADLFNLSSRLVVVTEDVNKYWDPW